MTLRYSAPTALEYFATLVQSDEHFPLLEAAACVAHDEYPELDVQQLLGDVDQLQARLRRRLAPDAASLQRLQVLNQFFYGDLGFGGNVNNYYDPENSYLNAVLRTRRGIPVSLAVLWMELAQGLGLQVRGVAFPGHFMVKALLPQGQAVNFDVPAGVRAKLRGFGAVGLIGVGNPQVFIKFAVGIFAVYKINAFRGFAVALPFFVPHGVRAEGDTIDPHGLVPDVGGKTVLGFVHHQAVKLQVSGKFF